MPTDEQQIKKIQDYLHLEWRPIPGFYYYQASDIGEIRSLDKVVSHNYGGRAIKRGKILSKHIGNGGYYRVGLSINGKIKTTKVSILVAMAWHPNPLKKKTVNHKDTNKLNDHKDNLEWATQQENVVHAIANNCRKSFKLSDDTIKKIVDRTNKAVVGYNTYTQTETHFKSISEAAKYLFVSQSAVSHAMKNNRLVLGKWKFCLIEAGLAIDAATLKQ